MSTVRDRHQVSGWFRRQVRRPAVLGTGLVVVAALLSAAATALTSGPAAADTTTSTQSFTQAGTYYVTVPQNVTAFSLDTLGGAGAAGQPSSDNVSTGGAGGSGNSVTETFDSAVSLILPGDVLQFVVGAGGGGGGGGTGDGISGNGGNGGGVTYIYDQTSSSYVLVAAGGGGGGGGSGLWPGYNGGRGGTAGPGGAGLGPLGTHVGAGGSLGPNCFASGAAGPDEGGSGQKAPSGSADGGGGGGGGGVCGGSGGKADGGSGAGGGGSGYSWVGNAQSSYTLTPGDNTGDGSASVTFTMTAQAPAITSDSCMYGSYNGNGRVDVYRAVTATGIPLPTLSLLNSPSWLILGQQVDTYPVSGVLTTSAAVYGLGTVADGQYTVAVEAINNVGSIIEPLSLAIGPGSGSVFVSDSSATATVGVPFDFPVRTASCPPIASYFLQSTDSAISGWLTLGGDPVELLGTPTAAAVGTHTFTIIAQSVGGTVSISQSFTLTVNPPPPAAPDAPVIGTAAAGNAQATVSFTPPATDGGAAITSYTVTAKDSKNVANGGQTATGTGSPVTVTGLTNGDVYTFTVTATNSVGTGPASSASNAVIPASAPGAPVIGAATAGNAQATVNFLPPDSNGGASIASYTVTATDHTNAARGGQTAAGTGSPVTVTGLTNGDSYTFAVTATNWAGTGPASSPSNAVTPEPPGTPSADLSVTLSPHPTAADGSTFTETVTVTNHGPWAATHVRTAVRVPDQLTVTAAPGGTRAGPKVWWVDASLGANDSVTYTITFKVAAKARGTALIAAATASTKVADPKPLNNAATITVKFR
jgi:hypothetical protein